MAGLFYGKLLLLAYNCFNMRACRFFLLICFLFANSVFATITPGSLPDGTKGLTYTAVRFTSDKVSSTDPLLRWQVPGKPNNIDINRDGVYMGTPSEAGNFTLTVSVYSGARLKDTLTLIHKISETLSPTINGPYTLPDGQYDRPYAQTSGCRLRASGGTPYASNSLYPSGYRWEKVVNGQSEFVNLPRGLELSANGTIFSVPTGPAPIPTSDQTYKFKAKATDKVGKFSVAEFTMVIKKSLPPRILSECPLPEGIEQMQYIAHTLSAAGGKSPYFWSTTPALPAGLVLDSGTGIISGKPTVPGNFSFQIVLRDANGLTANKSCSIKINAIPYITTSAIFDCASVGSTKCSEVEAIGGATPYTWAMVSGPPLTGYSDAFVGTPTITPTPPSNTSRKANVCATFSSAGNFTVWVQVTAPGKPPTKKAFGFRVYDTLAITNQCPLAGGTKGRSYNATLTATGGKPSYTWSLVPANTGLPPGLSLNATTGVISGTPTAAGNFTFSYQVTDSCSRNDTKNCTMTILDPCNLVSPLSFATLSPLSSWVVGQYNEYQFAVTGGLSPYVFEIDQSTLPPGVSANSQGKIFGTPTQVASSSGTPEVYWVQWNSPSSYPFTTPYNHARATTGKINIPGGVQIEVTLSGEILKNASAFGVNDGGLFWGPPNVYKSSIVPSLPTNSDHISIDGRAFPAQKINFTSAGLAKEVSNIVMFIWSLGSPGDSAKYMFENDFDVLTANQFFIKNGRQLEGSEGHGSIVFPGKFTSIAWNMPDPEHYNSCLRE